MMLKEVYNPWNITNYVKDIIYHNTEFPKPYWSNTSSTNIIQKMVAEADNSTVQEIESLLAGNTIEKQIHEDITYGISAGQMVISGIFCFSPVI